MDVEIRIARAADAAAIAEVYNQAVRLRRATADLDPVTPDERRGWLRAHPPERHPVFVAEAAGRVVGWCSLSPYRPGRGALRHTAEVSYYVDERDRGAGVGTRLVKHAVARCPALGIRTLIAVVIDGNAASTALLERLGFARWGVLPGVVDFDGREHAHLYYGRRVEGGGDEGRRGGREERRGAGG